jgi:hypothetical protein
VRKQLDVAALAARYTAYAFGDGNDLTSLAREQGEDAVSFAEVASLQDDRFGPVEADAAHDGTL